MREFFYDRSSPARTTSRGPPLYPLSLPPHPEQCLPPPGSPKTRDFSQHSVGERVAPPSLGIDRDPPPLRSITPRDPLHRVGRTACGYPLICAKVGVPPTVHTRNVRRRAHAGNHCFACKTGGYPLSGPVTCPPHPMDRLPPATPCTGSAMLRVGVPAHEWRWGDPLTVSGAGAVFLVEAF